MSEARSHVTTCADAGQCIRHRRVSLSRTLRELADGAYLTEQTVGAIERAQTDPYLSSLAAIVDALGGRIEIVFPER